MHHVAVYSTAFGKAYTTLHSKLRAGSMPPGSKVTASAIQMELGCSATPIREALSRLAGQDMLVDRPSIGYFVPTIDPVELKDLYAFAAILAQAALDAVDPIAARLVQESTTDGFVQRTAGEMVRAAASLSLNRQLRDVAINIDDRLARLDDIDRRLFGNPVTNDGDLEQWIASRTRRSRRAIIGRFFARREQAVLEIASIGWRTLERPKI